MRKLTRRPHAGKCGLATISKQSTLTPFTGGAAHAAGRGNCSLLIALLPSPLRAEARIALVIGNSAYQNTAKLINPQNDAADMAAALKKLGFQLIEGFDLDKAALDRKIRDFATALRGADMGVFFYAGHGLQVAGQNYLVPVLIAVSQTEWRSQTLPRQRP